MSSNYPLGAEQDQNAPFNEELSYTIFEYRCEDCGHQQDDDQYCDSCMSYNLELIEIN